MAKKVQIQSLAYTKGDWDPAYVLLDREIGYEKDTGLAKMGDGVTPWANLPYMVKVYAPTKGTDYWTEEDQNEIKNEIKSELPSIDVAHQRMGEILTRNIMMTRRKCQVENYSFHGDPTWATTALTISKNGQASISTRIYVCGDNYFTSMMKVFIEIEKDGRLFHSEQLPPENITIIANGGVILDVKASVAGGNTADEIGSVNYCDPNDAIHNRMRWVQYLFSPSAIGCTPGTYSFRLYVQPFDDDSTGQWVVPTFSI